MELTPSNWKPKTGKTTFTNSLMMIVTNQLPSGEKSFHRTTHRQFSNLTTSPKAKQAAITSRPALFEEDQHWLAQVAQSVQQNLANNRYTIAQLAHEVAVSERHLRRQLKQLLGIGPKEYVTEMRMQLAKELLFKRKYKTLSQVAHAVGYRDVDSFRSNFCSLFGECPKEYLRY
jgi:AraC-like DNA-binding protein